MSSSFSEISNNIGNVVSYILEPVILGHFRYLFGKAALYIYSRYIMGKVVSGSHMSK